MVLPLILPEQRGTIEDALRAIFAEHSLPLFRLMEYQMGWLDEHSVPIDHSVEYPRQYSALCFAACQAVGGQPEAALSMAAALELVDNFFQVHMDVQEGSQERYNRPTVWWVWGPGQAINVGDAFHALARLSIMASAERGMPLDTALKAVQMLDVACLRVCEGIHVDLVYQERVDVTVDSYLRMVREKVGALMGCALELGVLSASASPETARGLREFGEDIAVASRIQEDAQVLWGEATIGETMGSGLLNKKKTLPVAYVFEEGSISQKRALGNIYFKRVLEASDLVKIVEILDTVDARTYVHNTMKRLLNRALDRLNGLDISPGGRSDLERIAQHLTHQDP
ncbi:MAG: polyprenyl synthetase family protein [Chloroflexi bacterium]|nr:polyprenyl synthetase family protein [Chloroflexota bacterium]